MALKIFSVSLIGLTLFVSSPASACPQEIKEKESIGDIASINEKKELSLGSTVLLIGDSLAFGMSQEFKKISRRTGYSPVVHAISSTSTFQWLARSKKDVNLFKPDLVLISLGTNDARAQKKDYFKKFVVYKELYESLKKMGVEVVWIGPPKLSKNKLPSSDIVSDTIKNSIPLFFDSRTLDIPQTDGIHSTHAGYSDWIDKVWDWMSDKKIVFSRLQSK